MTIMIKEDLSLYLLACSFFFSFNGNTTTTTTKKEEEEEEKFWIKEKQNEIDWSSMILSK